MLRKELLKLGIITTATVITTACLVGCTKPGVTSINSQESNILTDYILTEENKDHINSIAENISVAVEEVNSEIETEIAEDEARKTAESLTAVTVVRVVDGDTYVVNLDGEETKVRLIGVDTPESVASQEYLDRTGKENTEFGKDVSDYMKGMLSEGSILYLEFDVDKYDKYDRVLAYAYFEDGEMVQEHLLKKGFARVMTIEPNVAHSERFVELEQEAMNQGVGMWEGYEDLFNDEQER